MFTISKKLSKILAVFLMVLMIVTNPAFIPLVSAATSNDSADAAKINDLATLTVDKNSNRQAQSQQVLSDSSNLTNGQKALQFANTLIPYYLQGGKKQGPEWLKTTDINFTFMENAKPIFSLETIQSFGQTSKNGQLWFWQGRYAYESNDTSTADTTANLGVGWRKLSADKTSIVGLNTFYDYTFKHDLSRVGVGAEYYNKLAEYRANVYIPTSG